MCRCGVKGLRVGDQAYCPACSPIFCATDLRQQIAKECAGVFSHLIDTVRHPREAVKLRRSLFALALRSKKMIDRMNAEPLHSFLTTRLAEIHRKAKVKSDEKFPSP